MQRREGENRQESVAFFVNRSIYRKFMVTLGIEQLKSGQGPDLASLGPGPGLMRQADITCFSRI